MLFKSILAIFSVAAMAISAMAQAILPPEHSGSDASAPALLPGIIVEKLEPNGEGRKSGMQPGDILLTWSRGDASGSIESPFDLADLEVEQEARGTVTISGVRRTQKKEWRLGPDPWKIGTHPAFSGAFKAAYSKARELEDAGHWSVAAEHWRTFANQVQGAGGPWLPAWVYFHAAEVLAKAGQWKQADAAYQAALQAGVAAGPLREAQLLRTWAGTFVQRSDWDKARKRYLQAVEKEISGSLSQALDFQHLAHVARLRGDLGKARDYLLQALSIRQKLVPDSIVVAGTLTRLCFAASLLTDLDIAEEYGRRSIKILLARAPGSMQLSAAFRAIATVFYQRGDLDKAENYTRQSLEIAGRLAPDSRQIALASSNLGLILWERGDLTKAERYLQQALGILQKLAPDSLDVAACLDNLGIVAFRRGDLAEAENFTRRSLAIREKLAPATLYVAANFNTLGVLAWQRGDWSRANEYFLQSLKLNQRLEPGGLDAPGNLYNLGLVALSSGDLDKAEKYSFQALAGYRKKAPHGPNMVLMLSNLGLIAQKRGNFAQARKFLQQGLEVGEKVAPGSVDVALTLNRLGAVERESGNLQAAEKHYQRAFDLWEKLAPASINRAETLAALASIARQRGKLHTAAQLYQQALSALENQIVRLGGTQESQAEFRGRYESYYKSYVDLLVRQQKRALALQVLERSRARMLLETLALGHVDVTRGADPDLLKEARSLQVEINSKAERRAKLVVETHSEDQLKAVEKEISGLLAQYREVRAQIRSRNPAFASLVQPQPLTTREIQERLLDGGTLLLEYSLGKERSYLFIVARDSLTTRELPGRSVIEKTARHLYETLNARNRFAPGETPGHRQARIAEADAEYPRAAAALSRMVLAPAGKQLKGKRLLIVAEGALDYIPFSVLPEPHMPRGSRVWRPLVLKHEIVNLPSASVLDLLRRESTSRSPAPGVVAVLADPVFSRQDPRAGANQPGTKVQPPSMVSRFSADLLLRSTGDLGLNRKGRFSLPRLRFSRQEAGAILAVTPAGKGKAALDFDASRAAAMSPQLRKYRIVHFATHGLLNSVHPELSGLVFSLVDKNGKPQNGFLQLQDIYNMNLPADLVVLSACETGLGKEIRGEGLIGLTRGFMYAGASRVVASLWNVSDIATARLMARFYRAMEKDGLPPAAALRAAQVAMWKHKRWHSPYYWAAFQIQGEYR